MVFNLFNKFRNNTKSIEKKEILDEKYEIYHGTSSITLSLNEFNNHLVSAKKLMDNNKIILSGSPMIEGVYETSGNIYTTTIFNSAYDVACVSLFDINKSKKLEKLCFEYLFMKTTEDKNAFYDQANKILGFHINPNFAQNDNSNSFVTKIKKNNNHLSKKINQEQLRKMKLENLDFGVMETLNQITDIIIELNKQINFYEESDFRTKEIINNAFPIIFEFNKKDFENSNRYAGGIQNEFIIKEDINLKSKLKNIYTYKKNFKDLKKLLDENKLNSKIDSFEEKLHMSNSHYDGYKHKYHLW
jgi:hypothetical protein